MNELIEKLNNVKKSILNEKKGSVFYFFGLVERVDLENKWDLLISTDWLKKENQEKDLVFFIEKIKTEFGDNFDFISKIVLFTSDEEFLLALGRALEKEDESRAEFFNIKIADNFTLKHLYVLYQNFKSLDLGEEFLIRDHTERPADF